jgi:hypothetical protein
MNRLTVLVAASLLLGAAPPLLAQAPPSSTPLMRGDVSGTVGWVVIEKGDHRSYNDWHSQFAAGAGAGWYWTDHHKTQVDFTSTTAATVYSSEPIIFTVQQQTFVASAMKYRSQRLSLTQLYQFRRNEWAHPFLGVGLDIVREESSRRDEPVYWYDPITRQSRLAQERVQHGRRSEVMGRGVLTAGVKAYFSRKVFGLTDLRVGIGRHRVEDVQWRFGLGADF